MSSHLSVVVAASTVCSALDAISGRSYPTCFCVALAMIGLHIPNLLPGRPSHGILETHGEVVVRQSTYIPRLGLFLTPPGD